jgi:hypothetical protein
MARPKAQLRLGAFFNPTGHHVASWRHPKAQADAGINFRHYVEIAQTAERGKFDMSFWPTISPCARPTWRRFAFRAVHFNSSRRADRSIRRDEPDRPRLLPRPRATEPYHVARSDDGPHRRPRRLEP